VERAVTAATHRPVHARERLVVGLSLLEADLGREAVGVDQQQHKVGPAAEAGVGDRGLLRCRPGY
jgi:hypothetical protein